MDTISFPGLGLKFTVNPTAFTIGSFPIAWYGIIIAVGLLLAMLYGMKRAKEFNVTVDDLSDVIIFSIIFGVIGARLYYVLFYIDEMGVNPYFSNPLSIFDFRSGGLGIYGGMIAAFVTAFIVCKIKKISVGAVFDIAGLGFLIGQAIGRWGNFVNEEAYGATTNLPWRMVVSTSTTPVHPCFLYESLWCVLGFVILHIYSKRRKFNGEIFLMYIAWYSFGRFFIEGLRSDSLMLGYLKISQLVAAVLFVTACVLFVYKHIKRKDHVEQENAEYNPLFEDTSRAVEADTAEAEKQYMLGEEDGSSVENGSNVVESSDTDPDVEKPETEQNPENRPEDEA
jgi:phosphatidylglycerol---prolipoprotein diacylglyceryl transferase